MSGKILIVDDDKDYCNLLFYMLENAGYEVQVRNDPATGLTALRQDPRPDLVILDVNMPKGGGKLFYQTLRRDPDCKNLPVIVATANQTSESIYQLLDSRPHASTLIMRKPLELSQLQAILLRRSPPKPQDR